MKRLLLLLLTLVACGDTPSSAPGNELAQRTNAFGAPLSSQGGAPVTSFTGIIDATNSAFAGGMATCAGGCSSQAAEQNRAALKSAIDAASSQAKVLYIPPGAYPIGCASGQSYGVDFGGDANIRITGFGATLRFTGDQGNAACSMLWLRNTSGIKLEGLTFSQRDVTNATASTVAVKLGDGGTTSTTNVQFVDVQFIEGVGGDFVRLDGGTSASTVTKISFERDRFEGSARGAIDIRPGTQLVSIIYNFFRSNANRDIWFEDTGDGPIGQATISGNIIETDKAFPAVTLAGHGGSNVAEQTTFTFNRIKEPIGAANGGGAIEGTHLARTLIAYNSIWTNRSTSTPSISLTGDVDTVWISDNYVDRRGTAGNASVIAVVSDGTNAPIATVIRGNRVKQYSGIAPGIDISGCARCTVSENNITYHASTADSGATGFVGVYCSGLVNPCGGLVVRNRVKRDDQDIYASLNLATVTTNDNTVIQFRIVGTPGNTATIQFVGDSATAAGSVSGTSYAQVFHFKPAATTVAQMEALFTSTTMQVKTTGTQANVLQAGDAFGPTNLAGAVQAGRPLAGVEILKGTQTTVNRLLLRDNWIDGARALYYSDADGASTYPEGVPVFSGNGSTGVTNETEGGITTYRTESTSDAEAISSGALSVSKRTSFITTSGAVAYSLPDGIVDGYRKCFKVKTATGGPSGTLTPAHMADGTSHTITWSAAGGYGCLAWDATATTWRVLGTSGVTVN